MIIPAAVSKLDHRQRTARVAAQVGAGGMSFTGRRSHGMRTSKRLLMLSAALVVGVLPSFTDAQTTSFSGDLFYTTFGFIANPTVNKVAFSYNGSSFTLGS